ncbi:MAG: ChaN family lipoprotein [Deltaproteobacteria bacterium]|nr:ChaN family lipoprotein [Deltaproteobacteria bacterium]
MKEVLLPELTGRMKTRRVVFIGEVHSRSSHHEKQLQIIQALHEAGFPMAIGLEMFRSGSQKDIDKWLSGQMDDDAFLKVYYDNWQIEWPQYRAIFLYAKQNQIPLVGLNIPWSIIRQVVKGGVKSLKPEDSAGLADITCSDADARYRRLIKDAMDEHGKHGEKSGSKDYVFDNFCEAQMVWDISMARRIAGYLKENPDKNMVVLAGGAHSWKRGIPKQLSRIADTSLDAAYITLMPEMNDTLTTGDVTPEDTDYIWTDPWGWLDIGD